ncbi:universal stress protein [Anthocerotibacter panamensis]|uniref:universal stress protein n=1 Tax=Anthocerotibacter panamensis TaxID=2857077 RepID=UPI001C402869|nr:universal stress protein [Anthocerotibacter panamensis]
MLNTVLVAVDHAPTANRVLDSLGDLNLPVHCRLVLAHAMTPPDFDTPLDVPGNGDEVSIFQDIEHFFDALTKDLPYPVEREVVMGDPADEILRLARIYKADLIIIGSRGLKGVERVLKGSVSSQVVAESWCSVLVVKLDRTASSL